MGPFNELIELQEDEIPLFLTASIALYDIYYRRFLL